MPFPRKNSRAALLVCATLLLALPSCSPGGQKTRISARLPEQTTPNTINPPPSGGPPLPPVAPPPPVAPTLPPATSPLAPVPAGPDTGALGITLPSNIFLSESGVFSPAKSLRSLEKDLAKVKNMGVGWVRMAIPWYEMTDANNSIIPERRDFLRAAVLAAKVRGIRVLLQIGQTSRVQNYSCLPVGAQPDPATVISFRMDFCVGPYKKFIGDLLDIVSFHVQHFEVFNEVNWDAGSPHLIESGKAQLWTSGYYAWGPFYVQERMKELYYSTKEVMREKSSGAFQPLLLSSGLSYGYDTVTGGPETPAQLQLAADPRYVIEARNFLTAVATGWQPGAAGHNTYRDDLDILGVHPYREPGFIASTLHLLFETVSMLGAKPTWVTEINCQLCPTTGGSHSLANQTKQVTILDELMSSRAVGKIDKVFWYSLSSRWNQCAPNPDCINSYQAELPYVLYEDDLLVKPLVRDKILAVSNQTPLANRLAARAAPAAVDNLLERSFVSYTDYGAGGVHIYGLNLQDEFGVVSSTGTGETGLQYASKQALMMLAGSRYPQVIRTDFQGVLVPATGVPTLRTSLATYKAVAQANIVQRFSIVISRSPSDYEVFHYDNKFDGADMSVEIDLSAYRGQTITIGLMVDMNGQAGAWGGSFLQPQIAIY